MKRALVIFRHAQEAGVGPASGAITNDLGEYRRYLCHHLLSGSAGGQAGAGPQSRCGADLGGLDIQILRARTVTVKGTLTGDHDVVVGKVKDDDLYVEAVRAGDKDTLAGIHVAGSPVERNGGAAQVSVKDADGKPQPNFHVEVVPDPPRRKQRALYSYCSTDATGACAMLGITPGAYRVFASAPDREIDFRNPDEIAAIEDSGTAFTIKEGEKQQLEVKPIDDDKPI